MRIILFAALTAPKQKEAARWNTPHTLTFCQWALTFLNVAHMELNYIVQVRWSSMYGLKMQMGSKTWLILYFDFVFSVKWYINNNNENKNGYIVDKTLLLGA